MTNIYIPWFWNKSDKIFQNYIKDWIIIQKNIKEIEKCAVFSIQNEEIEEEIVLAYSAKTELNSSEILFELKNHLASYMLPSRIIYKKSLPLVSSDKNKINKEELKKEFILKYID